MSDALLKTDLPLPVRRGKVRDVYELGENLLIVSTDRISAFDWILPTGIPDKGRLLTQMSLFWFNLLDEPHHVLETDVAKMGLPAGTDLSVLTDRSMLVKRAHVIPVECVARGYLVGSGWKDYLATGSVCGLTLPPGLEQASQLPQTLFTPATKAEEGHDENISLEEMIASLGPEGEAIAQELKSRTLAIYRRGAAFAAERGILIADTKLEWGWHDERLILVDEVLTPDSSRFWPQDLYRVGISPPSYDKQFVRDWLSDTTWDKNSPPPELPTEIVQHTREKYVEAFERITGQQWDV